MDLTLLEQHEAFLRAIFDDPDKDVHKLVFADFLEEDGQKDRAMMIRVGVEGKSQSDATERGRLLGHGMNLARITGLTADCFESVIFGHTKPLEVMASELEDLTRFRIMCVEKDWNLFGASELQIVEGRVTDEKPIATIFAAPATSKVFSLVFRGVLEDVPVTDLLTGFRLIEVKLTPRISLAGVEALAATRQARKLVDLDLTHNDLDNDAARALIRSPYLNNLKTLRLLDGNRLRGRVWQQVVARFGAEVAQ